MKAAAMVLAFFINVFLLIVAPVVYFWDRVLQLFRRLSAMSCLFGTRSENESDIAMPASSNRESDGKTSRNKNAKATTQQKSGLTEGDVKQLTDKLDEQNREIEYLREENKSLQHEYKQIKARSDKITTKMADIMENKSDFENTGDKFRNSELVKEFENVLQDRWLSLMEERQFSDGAETNELQRIAKLTSLMERCYVDGVVPKANSQIRAFLFLKDDKDTPEPSEEPELYKIRRKHGRRPDKVEEVKKDVFKELALEEEEGMNEKMKEYLHKFIEYCWLMTISNDPLVLNFDVKDKPFNDKLIDRFKKYATQEDVVDTTRPKGTITLVVWPCVEAKDGSIVMSKGEVVTVDRTEESTV